MTCLSTEEIEILMEYTGMEEAMHYELEGIPVVHFSRSKEVLNFVTIVSDMWEGI
jgi:hypothetical protein